MSLLDIMICAMFKCTYYSSIQKDGWKGRE